MKYIAHKHTRGFTLIEMLLYIALASILLVVATMFTALILEARIKNQTIAEVEQQGQYIARLITQTIRNAEEVTTPGVGSNSTSLVLDVVAASNDPTTFSLSSGVVRIQEGGSTAVPLSNDRVVVSNLVFYNYAGTNAPGIVRFSFTVTHANPEGRNAYSFTKTFYGSAATRVYK